MDSIRLILEIGSGPQFFESVFLAEPTRKYPVVLDSYAFTETVSVKLPGSYKTSYEVKAGTIPADQYQTVRSFYQRVRAAEQAPVVLARK